MRADRQAPSGHPGQPGAEPMQEQPLEERGANRTQRPVSRAFREFIAQGWQPRPEALPGLLPAAPFAARRRARIAARFPGERLVIPAGPLVRRSNDTDYRFRPHSAFAHLTGLGADREPDAVLVLEPDGEAALYFRPRAERDAEEFYADSRYGELWVGPRPSLAEVAAETGLRCFHADELPGALAQDAGRVRIRVVSGADPAVSAAVEQVRHSAGDDGDAAADAGLVTALSELRLVKDEFEIAEMRRAVAATIAGFEDVARSLPRAVAHPRGERVIEGVFGARAREDGNGVGYETIAAAGDHACTLHWIRNDGPVEPGRLVLIDAGVEVESLYTADLTRTIPVSGRFTEVQRRVYHAVLDAADAAFSVVRPGIRFREVHAAAMAVIADRLEQWGLLPVPAVEALQPQGQYHRRWMVHGTSHHLGLDVHDCAQARREAYLDGALEPGMIFTIEPGLYFSAADLSVPEEYRGIGVRIEDDVLVTEDGCENLSAALPRGPADVEVWLQRARGK